MLATWRTFFYEKKRVRQPFKKSWRSLLVEKVRFYQVLNAEEKDRFEQAILYFLDDIVIVGADTEVEDLDKILVASSAVIPIFGFPQWEYRNLGEVFLYANSFNKNYETTGKNRNILGQVGSGAMNRVMILSKPALRKGFDNEWSKSNVGIHEFVHLLDKSDGAIDGLPEMLAQRQFTIPWVKMMHDKIVEIKKSKSDINPYGATNQAEFLSVVSEYFFSQPELFSKKHPELFNLMEEIFRQDLA